MVDATVEVYQTIAADLLPIPAKSHYTFNVRDLAKVFQGISYATPERFETPLKVVRLWAHECLRVFHDRLIDDKDRYVKSSQNAAVLMFDQ